MTHLNNRQRKGISVVLTTLIIVVASVVLASSVAVFGTSLFRTGALQQSMPITNVHIWYQPNGTSPTVEGAFVVRNSGDKSIAVDSLVIRGQSIPLSNWAVSGTTLTNTQTTAQFIWQKNIPATGTYNLDGTASTAATLTTQTSPVGLEPGKQVIIYFSLSTTSGVISSPDMGKSVTLSVNAGLTHSVKVVSVTMA